MASEAFDLRLATPFVVVAEELHFGHAAAHLGVAQPALSQQIARLEQQVGTRLLNRDGRKVTLTSAGSRFLVEAREIVSRASLVESAVRQGGGRLHVHVGEGRHEIIREIASSFILAHPSIQVQVSVASGTEAMVALERGEADVGFDLPGGVPTGFSYTVVARAPLGVACSVEHPLARLRVASWTDLEGVRYFVAPPGIADAWNLLISAALQRGGVTAVPFVGPRVPNGTYLAPSVAAGTAVLICTSWVLNPPPPRVAWVPLEPSQMLEQGLVWDDRNPRDPVRKFVAWTMAMAGVDTASTAGGLPVGAG